MIRSRFAYGFAITACFALLIFVSAAQQPPPQKKGGQQPTLQATAEQKALLQAKVDEIEKLLHAVQTSTRDEGLVADVAVYAKAGRWRLEFPGFFDQPDLENTLTVLDKGIERARQLQSGQSPWLAQKGRKVHGYYSALEGSVQPYGLSVPDSYDGTRPVRLYVWLHGRNARLTEASFIHSFAQPLPANSTSRPADVGQIQLDCYGRGNNANHWAGEVDVFEAIRDVQKRYKIDAARIILRGFSLGGAAAWHLALQYPDRWAAAEIGAGTWPRRSLMAQQSGGFPPHQQAVLRIWENITEWGLNAFNVPIAGHGGDGDNQVASIPPPPRDQPTRGQLESSLKVREQLEKEGFTSEGEPDFLRVKGTPSIFMISQKTAHSTSPVVRQRLDSFLKEWGDRGQSSPDHIRFLTYTTRYNQCYWITLDGLERHYERAEVNATRESGGKLFRITTKNLARLTLREMTQAAQIVIDGQTLKVKPNPAITLEKPGASWRVASSKWAGLHKTHGLQGPIDDAFLDPYLLVRPTGTPWNDAAHQEALKILERFDRVYARNYRAHPRVKDDKDVTEADFAKYNVALFGDPGSNHWIAKLNGKLPVKWTRQNIGMGKQSFSSADHLPVLVYPNPLSPSRYVVLNSGLTIDEREYNGDYSLPRLGDFSVLKLKGPDLPEAVLSGLFDESWQLPK